MNEATPQSVMTELNNLSGSQRRRSPRLASPLQDNMKSEPKMALGSGAVKRSIAVRKIAPRKTVVPSEHDKENQPRRSGSEQVQEKKQKISTPSAAAVPGRRASSASSPGEKKKKRAAMPSPILPSSPPPSSNPPADPEDAVWSQKVRRSYSRLSDKSMNRETLFGFEKLQTPEVMHRSRPALEVSGPSSGLNSFTSLLEAEDCGSVLPDPDIPGVAVVKEKRRRRKVQQIASTELDALAARMNAEFEQAEEFELVVE